MRETSPDRPPSPGPSPAPAGSSGGGPVFHYSRGHRLERASPEVRALNGEGANPRRFPFFGVLTATKPLAFLFFTIVIVMVIGLILPRLAARDNRTRLGGNTVSAGGMNFGESTVLVLKKSFREGAAAYTGAVDLAVSPAPGDGQPVWSHRIYFTPKNGEEFRFAVPFGQPELVILLQSETEQAIIKIRPE